MAFQRDGGFKTKKEADARAKYWKGKGAAVKMGRELMGQKVVWYWVWISKGK